ncbi:MAG: hypothetical protein ACRDRL_02680 [Sciscionella sp.]
MTRLACWVTELEIEVAVECSHTDRLVGSMMEATTSAMTAHHFTCDFQPIRMIAAIPSTVRDTVIASAS